MVAPPGRVTVENVMPLTPGQTLRLSRGRRMVIDWLHFSRAAAPVTVERVVRIPEVAAARLAANPRPGWYPVLLKAFALAAVRVPDVRRSLLTFPYARLYEHAGSVAAVTAERELDGEPAVLVFQVRRPEEMPLTEIDARFQQAKTAPLKEVAAFRRALRLLRLPRPVRRLAWWLGLRVSGAWRERHFGTFAASSVVGAGGTLVNPLAPLTTLFTFGPVGPDGLVVLRLVFDHRVMDGVPAARALVETEAALRGEVLAELRALAPARRAAV